MTVPTRQQRPGGLSPGKAILARHRATERRTFVISYFRSVKDVSPRTVRRSWFDLKQVLLVHRQIERKDASGLFSPVVYRPGASRGNAGVERITLAVADFDHNADVSAVQQHLTSHGLACVIHSTYCHTREHPRFRVVVPLAEPVAPADWPEVSRRWLAFLSESGCRPDPGCTDAARMYYLPSAPPGAPLVAVSLAGMPLRVQDLPAIRVMDAPQEQALQAAGDARPGDVYNERGDVLAVLERRGWSIGREQGPEVRLTRPGKDPRQGISATFGHGGSRMLYVFSSNAAPFRSNTGYSPFAVYALLEHAGDFSAAAKALAKQGYGSVAPSPAPAEQSETASGADAPARCPRPRASGREPAADWLVGRVLSGDEGELRLFWTPRQKGFIRLAHRTWPIRGELFRLHLRDIVFRCRQQAIRDEDLKRVVDTLDAKAYSEGERREDHLRTAPGEQGEIYLDLGDEQFRAVRITSSGWSIIQNPPVLFRRGSNNLALPEPLRGGSLDGIREQLNITDEQWILLASCAVGSLFPRGPFPLLCINGEQGSGKSTACRIIKELIDPAVSNLYSMPGNSHDVMVAAANNWVLAYENLSGIPPWLSDCLCVLSTGGGYSARALYTDEQEQVIAVQRPVLLNGITDLVTRPDLQSRAVAVTLEPISAYRTESEIREAIRKAVPYALGALLDAASAALDEGVSAPVDPGARMADFARRAAAAAPALGWRAQHFLSLYSENRRKAEEELLDSSPVATALRAFAEAHPRGWTGTMTELWEALTPEPRPREWPGNARGLSAQLRRYAPVLRRSGIHVSHETAHGRKRLVTITCGGANDPGFAPPV